MSAQLTDRISELTLRDAERLRRRLRRHPDGDERFEAELSQAEARIALRRAAVPAVTYPEQLPISARREEIAEAIRDHQVVVVAGETGSGKTTQLPKICLELGRGVRGMIGHTQPRRLAARTVAERIAEELGVPLGGPVGFAVRFTDRSREDTLVRLMTDGLLLAEIQRDRLLQRYDTIIVDEAHERSLNIDFLLGYLRRILPERSDLKVVITSATIDPARFAAHFGEDVPVVEVSGRTFPVEVRYRPTVDPDAEDDERDPVDAIGDAVAELLGEGRGDVLVFLSGEREIRDTADGLRSRFGDRLDVLPLFARLSTAEQQRVFRPPKSGPPRAVLATNVAETSLTVPGIRYVVDPGTARISRYSPRLKVQRLPIERISQASADQRKGRCGRVAEGICIRLYAEDDFEARPRFTDPEILRTSLASVILQMASVGLGDVEDFPFLDPPDRRQIRDGLNLLGELGAIDDRRRLTPVGRRIAPLPVDPRMARMVLEADRLGCADEVMIIVAALSIQDPRERPSDKQAQADQAHARFADETSDFLAYLALWRYLREQQHALSKSQFRRQCKAEYLHVLRVREWQDLVQQLRQSARAARVTRNQTPAEPAEIHRALLAGLLSHVGLKDARGGGREYLGARGTKFVVWPGSSLSSKGPQWIMVAELVETSRLFGRTAARLDPAWIEPMAEHLVKRSYSEPRWEAGRGSVVATEQVTLFGLPVASRTVAYGRIDPELSRALFLRRALVEGDWKTRHRFLEDNRTATAEVHRLEDRTRRRDILVDDQTLYDFFDARVPESVVSGGHFDRWWRDERRRHPDLLTYTPELLVADHARDALDPRAWPAQWKQGDLVLDLAYRFDPGAEDDGVTVHVPLRALGQIRATGFDWLVPGLRTELVTALLRALPKELRRTLVPVPQVAADVLAHVRPRSAPVVDAVAAALAELRGVRVPPGALEPARLPEHLRMRFVVEADGGEVLAAGRSLDALRAELRPRLQAELTAAASTLERRGLTTWDGIGELPRIVALPGTGQTVRAYPALVDEGATAGVRMLETPEAQGAAMRAGTRRLLLLGLDAPVGAATKGLSNAALLALAAAPHGSAAAVVDDATVAAIDALVERAGGPAWDEAGFARLRAQVSAGLVETVRAIVAHVVRILDAVRDVQRRLEPLTAPALQPARMDVRRQLHRLVFDGFIAATGAGRLADVERYLHGAARRLERLPSVVAADADRMRGVHELEELYAAIVDGWPPGTPIPAGLREVPWLLEELRISHFAQGLGTKGPVSAKRVRKLLEDARLTRPT